jgi:hypothetical protein
MAAFTTTQAGDWSDAATWGDSGPPGDGDTATVNHAVTVDANTVVGTGAAGDVAVNANLTIAEDVTLQVKGTPIVANAILHVGPGSILECSDLAATTGFQISTVNNQDNAVLRVRGTEAKPAIVRTAAASTGRARIVTGGFIGGGRIDHEWCIFQRMGGSGAPNAFHPRGSINSIAWRMVDCVVDDCGVINGAAGNMHATSIFQFERVCFKNTPVTNNIQGLAFSEAINAGGGGVRRMVDITFDKGVGAGASCNMRDMTVAGWHSMSGAYGFGSTTVWAGEAERMFFRRTDQPSTLIPGSLLDFVFIVDGVISNPHFIAPSIVANLTYTRGVLMANGSNNIGDGFVGNAPSVARTYTFRQLITLPDAADGDASCTGFSLLGNDNCNFDAERCTFFLQGDGAGTPTIAEGSLGHAGKLASFQGILGYSRQQTSLIFANGANVPEDDYVTVADRNCAWNIDEDEALVTVYEPAASAFASTPGVNDVHENPAFAGNPLDAHLDAWDLANGGPGTVANALGEMAKRYDFTDTFDSDYTVENYLDFVEAIFTPTNQNLAGAGPGGADIGAVAVQAGGGGALLYYRMLLGVGF